MMISSKCLDIKTIEELSDDLEFINDSQDVAEVLERLQHAPKNILEFLMLDSFFVRVADGEYIEIWGIQGIIPYLHKTAWRLK